MFERTGHRLFARVWLLALPLSACAAAPHARSGPATQPVQSDGSLRVRLADAVPLQTLTPAGWVDNLTDKLDSPAAATRYFGELDEFDDDDADKPSDTVPIIARKGDDGGWTAVALLGGHFAGDGWRYVARGFPDFRVARRRFAIAQVVARGCGEQHTLLRTRAMRARTCAGSASRNGTPSIRTVPAWGS